CDLARPQPTPSPFTPPTYAPGFATTPAATPAQADTDHDNQEAATGAARPAPENQSAPGGLPLSTGEALPEETVPVIAEVGGQVIELNMEVGQQVNAGDILLRIESSMLEAQRA